MIHPDDPLRILMPWLDEEEEAAAAGDEERWAAAREELVAALREAADAQGEGVTMQRFLNETGFTEYGIYKHFESWAELRIAAGLEARREANVHYSDDELLAEAVRVIEECGGFPTVREFNAQSRYPYHALYMRFGQRGAILRRCEAYRDRPSE